MSDLEALANDIRELEQRLVEQRRCASDLAGMSDIAAECAEQLACETKLRLHATLIVYFRFNEAARCFHNEAA